MPEHVHTLVWFSETEQISKFMDKWEELSSRRLKETLQTDCPNFWELIDHSDPIWQARYYGFNIWSRRKVDEKLEYIHNNPVRAGLVERTVDWQWSSARWYLEQKFVGLDIKWPPGLETDDEFDTYQG